MKELNDIAELAERQYDYMERLFMLEDERKAQEDEEVDQ